MVSFAKGHGTKNDFVLLVDPDDELLLTDAAVRFLCDRRGGIGGDGVLRAVRARHVPEWSGDPDLWFMDYRNADGSIAEMCGNGVRVFARHLVAEGLVPAGTTTVGIGTRAGLREAEVLPDGRIRVAMGRPRLAAAEVEVSLAAGVPEQRWRARAVDVGNPHAVVWLEGDDLDGLDLTRPPVWTPREAFPDGVNIEFVAPVGDHHVRMRVFERGVGETASCGTGTVAVAAALADRGENQSESTWRVDVPGGSVEVTLRDGDAWLTGPAEIVARGDVAWPQEEA
ncbi:diaminopimelate epimerase [Propioniciclava soli]|uniref:Diaminopimelate epimerase n=1 Tax=Propioniciclava soli TaxID=2775081 RepID=A0ABZ3CBL4_9ACTN